MIKYVAGLAKSRATSGSTTGGDPLFFCTFGTGTQKSGNSFNGDSDEAVAPDDAAAADGAVLRSRLPEVLRPPFFCFSLSCKARCACFDSFLTSANLSFNPFNCALTSCSRLGWVALRLPVMLQFRRGNNESRLGAGTGH